jgi:hypothetical protein
MAFFFAAARAGSKMAASMPITAMTTNSSIRVNPPRRAADRAGFGSANDRRILKLDFMIMNWCFRGLSRQQLSSFIQCHIVIRPGQPKPALAAGDVCPHPFMV